MEPLGFYGRSPPGPWEGPGGQGVSEESKWATKDFCGGSERREKCCLA